MPVTSLQEETLPGKGFLMIRSAYFNEAGNVEVYIDSGLCSFWVPPFRFSIVSLHYHKITGNGFPITIHQSDMAWHFQSWDEMPITSQWLLCFVLSLMMLIQSLEGWHGYQIAEHKNKVVPHHKKSQMLKILGVNHIFLPFFTFPSQFYCTSSVRFFSLL